MLDDAVSDSIAAISKIHASAVATAAPTAACLKNRVREGKRGEREGGVRERGRERERERERVSEKERERE